MKKSKKFICSLIFIIIMLIKLSDVSYAATVTLSQIVTKFNSSKIVSQYTTYGYEIKAKESNNSIIITTKLNGNTIETNTRSYKIN